MSGTDKRRRGGGGMDAAAAVVVHLRNSVRMPMLGLGTSHSGGYSHDSIVFALKDCGYRLIDTAKRYGCEEKLQSAIKECGIAREELFLTTKLWPTDYGTVSARKAFKGSRQRLGTDYIDLFMLHAPNCPSICEDERQLREDTWRQLEILLDEGYVRAIGVSNFSVFHLEELHDYCGVRPHVNQVEFHPYQNPKELHDFCIEHNIQLEGYCPLAKGTVLKEAPITEIATRQGKTAAQTLIRWSIQNNVITIPKSTKPSRVWENCQVFDFTLSEADMKVLNGLHDGRRIVDLSGIQDKIDHPLPDGYKLNLIQHQHVEGSRKNRTSSNS